VIFAIGCLIPGDPAAMVLGDGATQEDIDAMRLKMGLDVPPVSRYFSWLGKLLHGDMGLSTAYNMPVAAMIASRIGPTVSLSVFAMGLAIVLSLMLGMLAARLKGVWVDHVISVLSLLGISLPGFLLGLFLIIVFAVKLRWFPVSGYKPLSAGLFPHFCGIFMPAAALGGMYSAFMTRVTRASLIEILESGYVRTARAKGAGEAAIVAKHALKNAMTPLVTVWGQSFIGVLSGAAVVESMFGIPGIGSLVVNSIWRRDFQVIQSVILLIAVINVTVTLLTDIITGIIDPRVRLK